MKSKVLFDHIDYVMVMVSDMGRSVRFYRDLLGIPLKFDSPEWSEFNTRRTVLALHGGGKAASALTEARAGSASIGFYVDNLEAKYEELRAKGVRFTMPPMDREGEGIWLSVCLDPDGLPISIAERKE